MHPGKLKELFSGNEEYFESNFDVLRRDAGISVGGQRGVGAEHIH